MNIIKYNAAFNCLVKNQKIFNLKSILKNIDDYNHCTFEINEIIDDILLKTNIKVELGVGVINFNHNEYKDEKLEKIGCILLQGYYFSKPQPIIKIIKG